MLCSILGIKFDKSSLDAIREINTITNLSKLMPGVLFGGTLIGIFAGSKSWMAAENIRKTDFGALAQEIYYVPGIIGVTLTF